MRMTRIRTMSARDSNRVIRVAVVPPYEIRRYLLDMKILVTDDDPVLRTVVTAGMKALGHKVTTCETGTQAWAALRESHFHVVITDWSMPEMDGIQLTQALRKMPSESYTDGIMLTGHGTRDDYLTGVRSGVDAFLVKPLEGALLEAQLSIAGRPEGLQEHTKRM